MCHRIPEGTVGSLTEETRIRTVKADWEVRSEWQIERSLAGLSYFIICSQENRLNLTQGGAP
jgi:hypothetical protein